MSPTLPASIVTRLEHLGQALLALTVEHRDADLATLEAATLQAVRDALPHLLEAVLTASTASLRAGGVGGQACPGCGERRRVQSWRKRTLATVCGSITLERPWYTCQGCKKGWSPIDQTWQVAPRERRSAGVGRWLAELGARASFVEAHHLLELLSGLKVSPETVRQRTEQRGAELEEDTTRAREQVMRSAEAAEVIDPAPGVLVVETDGVMARYRGGWHEVKLGVIGGQVEGKLQASSYVAAREEAGQFGTRPLAEAARRGALEVVGGEGKITGRGLALLRQVVVLGDGAHWIWNLAAEHFGERVEIIDFYHATQHVWILAHALFGEGTPLAARWANFAILALAHEGAAALLGLLDQTTPPPAAAHDFRVGRQYFRANAAQAVLNVRCHLLSHRPLAA